MLNCTALSDRGAPHVHLHRTVRQRCITCSTAPHYQTEVHCMLNCTALSDRGASHAQLHRTIRQRCTACSPAPHCQTEVHHMLNCTALSDRGALHAQLHRAVRQRCITCSTAPHYQTEMRRMFTCTALLDSRGAPHAHLAACTALSCTEVSSLAAFCTMVSSDWFTGLSFSSESVLSCVGTFLLFNICSSLLF